MKKSLERYYFPDREEILGLLEEVSNCRNSLFHNLAKTSAKDFPRLEEAIAKIQEDTELFVEKINVVYAGLQKTLIPETPQPQPEQTSQTGDST